MCCPVVRTWSEVTQRLFIFEDNLIWQLATTITSIPTPDRTDGLPSTIASVLSSLSLSLFWGALPVFDIRHASSYVKVCPDGMGLWRHAVQNRQHNSGIKQHSYGWKRPWGGCTRWTTQGPEVSPEVTVQKRMWLWHLSITWNRLGTSRKVWPKISPKQFQKPQMYSAVFLIKLRDLWCRMPTPDLTEPAWTLFSLVSWPKQVADHLKQGCFCGMIGSETRLRWFNEVNSKSWSCLLKWVRTTFIKNEKLRRAITLGSWPAFFSNGLIIACLKAVSLSETFEQFLTAVTTSSISSFSNDAGIRSVSELLGGHFKIVSRTAFNFCDRFKLIQRLALRNRFMPKRVRFQTTAKYISILAELTSLQES